MNGKRNRENYRKYHRKNHYTAIWLPCLLTAAAVTFLLWDGKTAGEGEASGSQVVQAYDTVGEDGGSGTGERANPDGGEAQRGNTTQAGYPGEDEGRAEAANPTEGTASGQMGISGPEDTSRGILRIWHNQGSYPGGRGPLHVRSRPRLLSRKSLW